MPWYGSHPYLNEFIDENRCRRIMEVGVYSGDNAVSMVKAAMNHHPPDTVEYHGFDFFSYYSLDRVGQKLKQTGCTYRLYRGDTRDTLPEAARTLPKMDIIFIDGGKSHAEAASDWRGSRLLMHGGTGVYVHNADFSGVRRMVRDIPLDRYSVEVFHAPSEGSVALIMKLSEASDEPSPNQ